MLYLAPRHLPSLRELVDALGNPAPRLLAELLDVTPATVRGWLAADRAPRSARLALFWLTAWGQSALDADLANRAALDRALLNSLRDEVAATRLELARLARLRYGSANAHSLRADLLLWRVK